MNVFVSRISGSSWVLPVSLMCVILGFMIAMARITGEASRGSRLSYATGDQQARLLTAPLDVQAQYAKLSTEVSKLQTEKTKLENALGSQTAAAKVLNDNLQEVKIYAGLTDLEGPGIVVTLRDSQKQPTGIAADVTIHDVDVVKVVNELWACGADAISVNNHRVGASTAIRCVGPVIHIDAVPIASPIIIRVIGDADTLLGGMNLPLGVLSEIRQTDPAMVQMERAKSMRLPAYSGATTKKYAVVPKVKK